jgi:small basic protein
MAKIVQTLTRASTEYSEDVAQSLIRDLDAVIEKLNTSFQQEIKQEIEAKSFFLKELLTQPLIVVGGTTLTIKAGSADAFTFGVSYLNIKKEVTT